MSNESSNPAGSRTYSVTVLRHGEPQQVATPIYRLVDLGADAAPVLVEIDPASDDAGLVPLPIEVAVHRLNAHAQAAAQYRADYLGLTARARAVVGRHADADNPPPKWTRERLAAAQASHNVVVMVDRLCAELVQSSRSVDDERTALRISVQQRERQVAALIEVSRQALNELRRRDQRAGKPLINDALVKAFEAATGEVL